MERYQKILVVNTRHNLLPHSIVSVLLILLAPVIMGTKNLNQQQVSKIIEIYISLIGIILLIPTFIPDMNHDIRDLIRSKKEPMPVLHMIRTVEAIVTIALIGIVSLLLLNEGNCIFSWVKMFYTLMANAIFLGGLGMLVFSLSDQIVFAYMIPLVYYMINYGGGKKQFGRFYLFSMQLNSMYEKHYLMISGIVFIVGAIWFIKWKTIRKYS